MASKNIRLRMLLMVFGMVVVGTVNAQTNIQGTWESGETVVYFSTGGSFVIYKNGNFYSDGSYTIESQANQTQRVVLNFGIFDRMDNVYSFSISVNQLVLLDRHRGSAGDGNNILLSLGTYIRSSFVNSDAGNPLVGTWKGESEIYRFYRNAPGGTIFGDNKAGTYLVFKNEQKYSEEWRFRLTYNFSARPGAGEISFYGFNEDWSYGVFLVVPFTVNGNVLRIEYENGTREYIRQ